MPIDKKLSSALLELLHSFSQKQSEGIAFNQELLATTAFFPGGYGLYEPETISYSEWPEILILGQDFGLFSEFTKMTEGQMQDRSSPTWRNLLSLLEATHIRPADCFYGNVFIGLRHAGKSTGRYIGFTSPRFMTNNDCFLRAQLELIKPKLIITLGVYAPMVLARLTDQLAVWRNSFSFKRIDNQNASIQRNANFGTFTATCIALVHPCYRQLNVKFRRYQGYQGEEAERQMLKDIEL